MFENEVLSKRSYKPNGFCLATSESDWTDCRVVFAERYEISDENKIYIHPEKTSCKRLVKFIINLEKTMGIKTHSKFHKVKYKLLFSDVELDDAFAMEPCKFWLAHPLRWSFLTAVLKSADNLPKEKLKKTKSFAKYLAKGKYFKNKYALKRFLKGYTKIKKKKYDGWKTTFKNKNKNEVKKVLKK